MPIAIGQNPPATIATTNIVAAVKLKPLEDPAVDAKWRQQQLAKQTATEKARAEASEKLHRLLFDFLRREDQKPTN